MDTLIKIVIVVMFVAFGIDFMSNTPTIYWTILF
jgi:hypothetical protein